MVSATGLNTTKFEFNVAITLCDYRHRLHGHPATTVTPGSNYLSAPVADVGGTGNIFVGDSSANLYELTPAGATAATALSVPARNRNGGIRDSPIIDSTNAVGYLA